MSHHILVYPYSNGITSLVGDKITIADAPIVVLILILMELPHWGLRGQGGKVSPHQRLNPYSNGITSLGKRDGNNADETAMS